MMQHQMSRVCVARAACNAYLSLAVKSYSVQTLYIIFKKMFRLEIIRHRIIRTSAQIFIIFWRNSRI